MAPDGLPPERPPERTALAAVVDRGGALPDEAEMVRLAETDPAAFLEWCLVRYDREVAGYRLNFRKQERIRGELLPSEEITSAFREKPFSVLFDYGAAPKGKAQRVLYVKPADEKERGKLEVLPAGFRAIAGIVERDLNHRDAIETNRYMMDEFGLKVGCQRTWASWVAAKKDDALHVEFLGEKKIKELGDRPCWVLKRTRYKKPEESDGVADLTIYVDKQTWLQTGAVLKDREGKFLGEYLFRDVVLNPKFDDDLFTRKSLQK
jgi:hypothetical protein